MMRFPRRDDERGAAVVEFALILPILIVLILGLIEFGRIFNVQISITNAAREAARTMAIENDPALARADAINAAPSVNPALAAGNITITPADCDAGQTVTVTIAYDVTLLSGYFVPIIGLEGRGVMRCGG
ncbi:MAG: TadE family protein [Rhodoglobus sp.]|nr:TadE family protein [Rhodoglobus sp.]